MRFLITSILIIVITVFATISCSISEKIVSKEELKVYKDSAFVYDFEKEYKTYFKKSSQKNVARNDIDQGLYFLIQTSLKQKKQYSVAATQMFYTYLSTALRNKEASSTINFVLSATKALMEKDELSAFEEIVSSEDQLSYLVRFWENLDPDPTSTANEALLVFGKRLAYSLDNFQRVGFLGDIDVRSVQLLKYGIPTIKKEVRFDFDDLAFWLFRVYGESIETRIINETVSTVRIYFIDPSIEVWVYDNLSREEPKTLFLFGKRQGTGFTKLNSPDEIIPAILMRYDPEPINRLYGLNPTAAIIASMYAELQDLHPLMEERLMSMESDMNGAFNVSNKNKSMNIAGKERVMTTMQQRRSHSQLAAVTLMDDKQLAINTYSRSFRFINDNGEGENILFAYSNPIPALFGPALKSIGNFDTDLQLRHSLVLVDENGVSSSPILDNPSITIIPNPRANGYYPIQSVFSLKTDSLPSAKIRFRALLKQLKAPKNAPIDALTGIIAYGLNEDALPESLKLEEGKPLLSDIIFGYKVNDVDALTESSRYNLPFWVPEVAELPLGLDLSLYFEVYNLAGDAPSFVLNYNLQKAGTIGILRDIKSRSDVRSVFLAQGKNHKMDLTIDLADLAEGRYNLELEIKDRENSEIIKRDVEFIVIDAEKRLEKHTKKMLKKIGKKRE